MLHRAKPNERAHLVHRQADGFIHLAKPVNIGIDHDFQQMMFTVRDTPEHAIQQRPSLLIGMARSASGQLEELLRNLDGPCGREGAVAASSSDIQGGLLAHQLLPQDFFRQPLGLHRAAGALCQPANVGAKVI